MRDAVEHLDVAHQDLDLAGGQARVDRLGGARHDVAADGDHELGAQRLGDGVRLRRHGRVEHQLDDAAAVAQVDEDELAVVAAAGDPAGEPHRRADVARLRSSPGYALRQSHAGAAPLLEARAARRRSAAAATSRARAPPCRSRRRTVPVRRLGHAEQHGRSGAAAGGLLQLPLARGRRGPGRPRGARGAGAARAGTPARASSSVNATTYASGAARGRQRLLHDQGDALQAAAEAHAGRRRPAELLDEAVVAAAAADRVLRGAERRRTGTRRWCACSSPGRAPAGSRARAAGRRRRSSPRTPSKWPRQSGHRWSARRGAPSSTARQPCDLAVEGAQRVGVDALAALAAQLGRRAAQVLAQELDVGRAAGRVAHAVDEQAQRSQTRARRRARPAWR